MNVIKTSIEGLVIVEPRVFGDERGFFMETYNAERYKQAGINADFVQDNLSSSTYGVIRGLHYQRPPHTQSKLVYVISGKVLDVAVDIRPGSPTFGQYESVELSGDNKRQFFIPRGFAHGFAVLSEHAVFAYKCDNFYAPSYEAGIRYDDADIKINWQIPENKYILSDKDLLLPLFKDHIRL